MDTYCCAERKHDVDERLQQVIDAVGRRRSGLTVNQLRVALRTGLGSVGVQLPAADLEAWSRAIAEGERVRAATHYR